MESMQWIWIGIALLCMIAQIFVAGQSLLIAGIGAVLAALMALGGISLPWQIIAFVLVGGLGLLVRHAPPRRPAPCKRLFSALSV